MQKAILQLRSSLTSYDAREAQSIIDLLLEEICQLKRIQRIMHPDTILSDDQRLRLTQIAEQLSQGVPVQQALGYEWFCGQRFRVSSDVLIPRPETAELVQWICDDVARRQVVDAVSDSTLSVLDIGTGSGCIALSLARFINNSQVVGLDLSTAALDVAVDNRCQQVVDNAYFAQCDIFKWEDDAYFAQYINPFSTTFQPYGQTGYQPPLSDGYQPQSRVFNIVVSNPPYICQQEATDMSPVVLDHEPSLALFVPDDDPLLFYRTIARFALSHLTIGGYLYFEINAAYGAETCQMLNQLGFHEVILRQDINGRDRMIRARL